jgi:hypothetical protein
MTGRIDDHYCGFGEGWVRQNDNRRPYRRVQKIAPTLLLDGDETRNATE